MEISCNVILDLLPSYADGICSEDSKKIIEEHIKTCDRCQKNLEKMQAEDSSVVPEALDAAEFDHMKKVKQYYRNQTRKSSLLLILVLLILLSLAVIRNFILKESDFDLFGIGLVLMAAAYLAAGEERNMTRAKKKQMLLSAGLGIYAMLCMAVSFLTFYLGKMAGDISLYFGKLPFGISMYTWISLLRLQLFLVLLAETALTVIALVSGVRKKEDNTLNAFLCITGGILAFFYLMMQTNKISMYYNLRRALLYTVGYTVGILEDGAVAVLCYLLYDKRKNEKQKEKKEKDV